MMLRTSMAAIMVFIIWSILDFFIHGLILGDVYLQTMELWRPMEEMKFGLMYGVRLLAAVFFVSIYALLVTDKSLAKGALYGLLFGLGTGISMGYGTYSVMPIPYHMALTWFIGAVVEAVAAGVVAGLIVKAPEAA